MSVLGLDGFWTFRGFDSLVEISSLSLARLAEIALEEGMLTLRTSDREIEGGLSLDDDRLFALSGRRTQDRDDPEYELYARDVNAGNDALAARRLQFRLVRDWAGAEGAADALLGSSFVMEGTQESRSAPAMMPFIAIRREKEAIFPSVKRRPSFLQ